jgi:hypothetical protein
MELQYSTATMRFSATAPLLFGAAPASNTGRAQLPLDVRNDRV